MLSSTVHPLIGIDPEIRFGRACVAGTRISVSDVLGWLESGMSSAEIKKNLPELTEQAISACQLYALDRLPSYQEIFGREPDFRVTYRLFKDEEGSRKMPAYQHIRWNFRYEEGKETWMIYPEFLDPDDRMVPNGPFSPVGQADMFLLSSDARERHRPLIRPGVRGYFVEGPWRVGVCEMVEVLGLRQPASG